MLSGAKTAQRSIKTTLYPRFSIKKHTHTRTVLSLLVNLRRSFHRITPSFPLSLLQRYFLNKVFVYFLNKALSQSVRFLYFFWVINQPRLGPVLHENPFVFEKEKERAFHLKL